MSSRLAQIVVFLGVASLMVGGMHYYLWARLVRDPAWPEPWGRVATWSLVALGVSLLLAIPFVRMLPRNVGAVFAWAAYVWMGASFLLLLAVMSTDVARVILAFASVTDPDRRRFFARLLAVVAGAGGLAASALAVRTALAPWTVRRVRVPLANLPPELDGMTIVQLTDVHVGPTIGRGFIEAMVREVNRLSPDVVAITGDLVDGSVEELGVHVAPLADLRARRGVFFVTGNHEYYSGVDAWLAELGRLGVRVLRNERVPLGDGDARIDLAGVDDYSARRFGGDHGADMARALAGRDPSRPVVLLAHQPKAAKEAAERGVDLVLSGHTHGGQIWPWSALVALDQKYLKGLHRLGPTQLYVSEGTGYWGPPMRIGTSPEITVLTLTRA